MEQLVCGTCRTLLMYPQHATTVRCSVCTSINSTPSRTAVAHVECGGCGVVLMYSAGAQSVKCAVCDFVSQVSDRGGPSSAASGSGEGGGDFDCRLSDPTKTVLIVNPGEGAGERFLNVAVGLEVAA